jgi:hypothetical protein
MFLFLSITERGPTCGATGEHTVSEYGSTCGPTWKKRCPRHELAKLRADVFPDQRVCTTGPTHPTARPRCLNQRENNALTRTYGYTLRCPECCTLHECRERTKRSLHPRARQGCPGGPRIPDAQGSLLEGSEGVQSDKFCHSRFQRRQHDSCRLLCNVWSGYTARSVRHARGAEQNVCNFRELAECSPVGCIELTP